MNETWTILQQNLGTALWDTAKMVFISGFIGIVLGTVIGLFLYYYVSHLRYWY